ncbi:OpgC domain-containing protein [Paracoccus sediminilitoris]|uniref:OpgC domain-containing protein n=1 Tax=Paracoccus sediminilitoris TaxID=2202419 RepID=UPI000DBA6AA2|nr:OpgC domain-containing protein [Paracoccus sediminilitoris]
MKRLITLDMLRGYALLSIMVNHMPLSVMRSVTLPNFSIFDASELFVLLSGFLVGMVWRSVEAKEGRRTAQRRFARRSFEVWRAMILGALVMAGLSAALWASGRPHTAIWNQYAIWIVENPLFYIAGVASMWLQPNIIDVLAVYVVLIASSIAVVPLMLRWPLLVAVGSVVMWWFAPQLNAPIPTFGNRNGFLFNPFGWQMLFFTGTAMGLFRQSLMARLHPYRHALTVIAIGMFVFGCTIVIAARIGEPALALRTAMKTLYGEVDKWNLDGTRYLAIVAAAWLVAVPFSRPMEWFSASRLGVAFQQIGRGGLWSFVICVLLSVAGDAFQMNPEGKSALLRLAIDIWACVTLWWASIIWLEYGAPWQRARKTRRSIGTAA